MPNEPPMSEYSRTLNRLAKWRTVFASRWLGTRRRDDPECIAVKDLFEKFLFLRVEVSALMALLIERKMVTGDQVENQIIKECDFLDAGLRRTFPGFSATDDGIHVNASVAAETSKGWPP